jgi:hypothetical protein
MAHAIRLYKTGGSEVLVWEEAQVGTPGPGDARVRQESMTMCGVFSGRSVLRMAGCDVVCQARIPALAERVFND